MPGVHRLALVSVLVAVAATALAAFVAGGAPWQRRDDD
jgi:molybdate transport system permease protein